MSLNLFLNPKCLLNSIIPGSRGSDVDDGGDVVDVLRQERLVLLLLLRRDLATLPDHLRLPVRRDSYYTLSMVYEGQEISNKI